jgi:hypothetical protein
MLVEPEFFRTELLSTDSTTYAQPTVNGYAERTKEIVAAWKKPTARCPPPSHTRTQIARGTCDST